MARPTPATPQPVSLMEDESDASTYNALSQYFDECEIILRGNSPRAKALRRAFHCGRTMCATEIASAGTIKTIVDAKVRKIYQDFVSSVSKESQQHTSPKKAQVIGVWDDRTNERKALRATESARKPTYIESPELGSTVEKPSYNANEFPQELEALTWSHLQSEFHQAFAESDAHFEGQLTTSGIQAMKEIFHKAMWSTMWPDVDKSPKQVLQEVHEKAQACLTKLLAEKKAEDEQGVKIESKEKSIRREGITEAINEDAHIPARSRPSEAESSNTTVLLEKSAKSSPTANESPCPSPKDTPAEQNRKRKQLDQLSSPLPHRPKKRTRHQ